MKKKNKKIINKDEALDELVHFSKLIDYHDKLYYIKDNPEISDADYDRLKARNADLEKQFPEIVLANSPSRKVGSKPQQGFAKVTHKVPMLSLNNAFTIEEIKEFLERTRRFLKLNNLEIIELIAEPKIDGLSATLIYEKGSLILGATRGDGKQGENITKNIMFIKDIPKSLKGNFPQTIEVRGEIYISNLEFEKINNLRKKEGMPIFSTPRNAAAGSVRQLNAEITKSRNLGFYAYNWGILSSSLGKTLLESRMSLENFGFSLSKPYKICLNIDDIKQYYEELFKNRSKLDFDIDGVVYKLNDLSLYDRLGETDHSPRYSISHKFPPEKGVTILNDISFQVGRTGAVTPVAELVPLTIGGVRVKRATLHNKDEILRLGIKKGDTVVVQRAGDVIPQITGFVASLRPANALNIDFPIFCPSCNDPLEDSINEAIIRCNNYKFCNSQVLARLIHAVSRNALNIEGLGEKQLKELFDLGYVKNSSDIYKLSSVKNSKIYKQIAQLSGWGNLSVSNMIASIENSKRQNLDRFIYSLGIRHVGIGSSRVLAQYFSNVKKLFEKFQAVKDKNKSNRIYNELISINGLGEKAVHSIIKYFQDNMEEYKDLSSHLIINDFAKLVKDGPFSGKTMVFTGTLQTLSRSEAKNLAEQAGAFISSQISSKTDVLVIGNKPGSKINKAKDLLIEIIDEDKFLEIFRRK